MLTTRRPSVIATEMICLACGESMPLKLIEPAYDGKRVDIHTFTCCKCLLSEVYAFPWDRPFTKLRIKIPMAKSQDFHNQCAGPTRRKFTLLDSMTARPGAATQCAQCGDPLVAPEWSEHVNERCVRHLWSCEACGYEFETAVYLEESTA
jgi:ribosomal protein L37AE/L43A